MLALFNSPLLAVSADTQIAGSAELHIGRARKSRVTFGSEFPNGGSQPTAGRDDFSVPIPYSGMVIAEDVSGDSRNSASVCV